MKRLPVLALNLTLIFILLLSLGMTGVVAQAQPGEALHSAPQIPVVSTDAKLAYAPGRVVVAFQPGTNPPVGLLSRSAVEATTLGRSLSAQGVARVERLFAEASAPLESTLSQIYMLGLDPGADVLQAVKALSADPAIAWAEPDYLAYPAATTTDDPFFPDQWGLDQIDAPEAWDTTTGSGTVSIAIIDSGIDTTHPDLSGRLWVNPGEIAGNSLDDDNNGQVDDVNGWDFANSDNDPSDDNGHGTQVAGIVGAATDNGAGIAGVCWNCKLMNVKVMQAGGVANYSDIGAGVLYAAQKGARVINISLGGYSNSSALQTAIQSAVNTYGAVVVAGAGNDNLETPFYPAAYDEVLAVVGTDSIDAKVGLSNFGTWVDIAAPSEAISTTFQGGDYGSVDGTSYAAPFVAGVAGLLRSQHSDWSADTVRAHLIQTADDIEAQNPGFEGKLGSGRVNADTAVNTAAQPLLDYESHTVDDIVDGRPEPGTMVDLVVTLTNDWADTNNVQATLTSSDPHVTIDSSSAAFGDIPTYGNGTNAIHFQITVASGAPYNHDMDFTLNVTADGGYSANVDLTVTTASAIVYADATLMTQTWTNDRIYVINKETGIPAGETLTIEPGTEIRFDGNYNLNVAGELIADGTEEQQIIFTSNKANPTAGDWRHIKFLNSSNDATFDIDGNYLNGSIIRFAIIEYGQGIEIQDSAPFLSNSIFDNLTGNSINGWGLRDGLVISSNIFDGSGIDVSLIANYSQIRLPEIEYGAIKVVENKFNNCGIKTELPNPVPLNVEMNRIMGCVACLDISVSTQGIISGNLVANSSDIKIHGPITFTKNTLLTGSGNGLVVSSGQVFITENNFINTGGGYALKITGANDILATKNWWGTTDDAAIKAAIYDGLDEFGLGMVDYSSYLTVPEASAPAYVVDVKISPDTTLGIQTGTFDVEFNQEMDETIVPSVMFHTTKQNSVAFDTSSSDIPHDYIYDIGVDHNGVKWFGTNDAGVASFDDGDWTIYNESNSLLPGNSVYAVEVDDNGDKWFGTDRGLGYFDDFNWIGYDDAATGIEHFTFIHDVASRDGIVWVSLNEDPNKYQVAKFDGDSWVAFNSSNSDMPNYEVRDIAIDVDGTVWFSMNDLGLVHFDGMTWMVLNESNSGIPSNNIYAVVVDENGTKWFGTDKGLASFDGEKWSLYDHAYFGLSGSYGKFVSIEIDESDNLWIGLEFYDGGSYKLIGMQPSGMFRPFSYPAAQGTTSSVNAIGIDLQGNKWFSTYENGVRVLYGNIGVRVADNPQWINKQTYRTTYDVTSLVALGDYLLEVGRAVGTDGIEIASTVGYTFTVDYAGAIGDTTPPSPPAVTACAGTTLDNLSAQWAASDPDSAITMYSYAIGTTPGGGEVVNWTSTTGTSFNRTGLGLIADQAYYIAVKARNEGGLWSSPGIPDAVYPGTGICTTTTQNIYLPIVSR